MDRVRAALRDVNLAQYADGLEAQGYDDFEDLVRMTADELTDAATTSGVVAKGHLARFIRRFGEMSQQPPGFAASSAPRSAPSGEAAASALVRPSAPAPLVGGRGGRGARGGGRSPSSSQRGGRAGTPLSPSRQALVAAAEAEMATFAALQSMSEAERRETAEAEAAERRRALSPSAGPSDGGRHVVLDVANIGHYSAAQQREQLSERGAEGGRARWSWEQVKKAIAYYERRGVRVTALLNPHTLRRQAPMPPDLVDKIFEVRGRVPAVLCHPYATPRRIACALPGYCRPPRASHTSCASDPRAINRWRARPPLPSIGAPLQVPVRIEAKDPDDRFVLRRAYELNCQYVSNDNYTKWHAVFVNEGDAAIVRWLTSTKHSLHVSFMFLPSRDSGSAAGAVDFVPDKAAQAEEAAQAEAEAQAEAAPAAPRRSPASPAATAAEAASAAPRAGITLSYRIGPPFDGPLRSVYAAAAETQTVADLRTLIARAEGLWKPDDGGGRRAGRVPWASKLVVYDADGLPLRDHHDRDDAAEYRSASGELSVSHEAFVRAYTLRGLGLRESEVLFVLLSCDFGDREGSLADTAVHASDGLLGDASAASWLCKPADRGAFAQEDAGHQVSFSLQNWRVAEATHTQSDESLSVLCATLYCSVTSALCSGEERRLLLGWLWVHTRFPPLLHALHSVWMEKRTLAPKQQLAIAVGLHTLIATKVGVPPSRAADAFLALPGLLRFALRQGLSCAEPGAYALPYEAFPLVCASRHGGTAGKRLERPVRQEGDRKVYSFAAFAPGLESGPCYIHVGVQDADGEHGELVVQDGHAEPMYKASDFADAADAQRLLCRTPAARDEAITLTAAALAMVVSAAPHEAACRLPPYEAMLALWGAPAEPLPGHAEAGEVGRWLIVQPALSLKDSSTPRPSLTYDYEEITRRAERRLAGRASPPGGGGRSSPPVTGSGRRRALLGLCEGDGVVGASEKGEAAAPAGDVKGGGGGSVRSQTKIFSPLRQRCMLRDVDQLGSQLQALQQAGAPLPGLPSAGAQQQRAHVEEATVVIFDTSTSMADAAFPPPAASSNLELSEALSFSEAQAAAAVSTKVFVKIDGVAPEQLPRAIEAARSALGARKLMPHRDRESGRCKPTCHVEFASVSEAIRACHEAAGAGGLAGGGRMTPKLLRLEAGGRASERQRAARRRQEASRLIVSQALFDSMIDR